jgi:SAM-dependent methyltransferase
MFWDGIKLVTEQLEKYGLRTPFADLGGRELPLSLTPGRHPFDHIAPGYLILDPALGAPPVEDLPYQYAGALGTVVCLNLLERARNPFRVMAALYQLLREGGLLVVETAFASPYHPSANDLWRFSPDGLQNLAATAGFTVLETGWRGPGPGDSGPEGAQLVRRVYATLAKGALQPAPLQRYPLPAGFPGDDAAGLTYSGPASQAAAPAPGSAASAMQPGRPDPSDLVAFHNLGAHEALLNQLLAHPERLPLEPCDLAGKSDRQAADFILGEHFAKLARVTGEIASQLLFRAQWGYETPEWYDHRHHLLDPERHCTDFWTASADNAIRHLPMGGKVLDLCSGDGFYDYYFYRWRAQAITCVELNQEAHRAAVRNHSAPNIRHVQGDALEIELPAQEYDLVLIRGAIEHFNDADQQRLFAKAKKALKPGGWFCGDTVTNVEQGGVSLPSHVLEWKDEAEMRASLCRSFDKVETATLISRERITLLWACQKTS